MKNDSSSLIVIIVIALVVVGVGSKFLGLLGFVIFGLGLVLAGFMFLKSVPLKSNVMRLGSLAIVAASLMISIGVKHYSDSRPETLSSSGSGVRTFSEQDRARDSTLDGMDSKSQDRYDSLSPKGQDYVDEQMRRYDDVCSRSSNC